MDLLKAPRFPYQKRIHIKEHINLATEALKGFNPGIVNRICVTYNKNLEQRKFRTKKRTNNVSPFKSNSESYDCQLQHLTGGIKS